MNTSIIKAPSAQLAEQLTATLKRLCKNPNALDLVEKSLKFVFEALEAGKISLDMRLIPRGMTVVDYHDWQKQLIDAGVASYAGGFTPLIIDSDQLFLARYHLYHSQVHTRLSQLASELVSSSLADTTNSQEMVGVLNRLFPATDITPDWQKVAAALALKKRLCIISGGPGTGKTTTVLRVIAALYASENRVHNRLRIRLAAPTGKAAARMQESIRNNIKDLHCDDELKQQLQLEACTLHRLLGFKLGSVNFKHHAGNPLALDVLVIDESSMIDSAMMAKCLEALPVNARLILLGDKDQLAAVEPGSPFASMCSQFGFSKAFASELADLSGQSLTNFVSLAPQPLGDNLIFLHHSYRFDESSGIGQLAKTINAGQFSESLAVMNNDDYPDIAWSDYKASEYRSYSSKELDPLIDTVQQGFSDYLHILKAKNADLVKIFEAFTQFCILTATHKGHCGRIEINLLCQKALGFDLENHWYHGRPVMVSSNDYQTGLYNGDVGICLDIENNGELRVYFPISEGFKDFTPSRIPNHETAFSMTVHKSQGSEFKQVLFILPDSPNAVFTKALIYTAITRAKHSVELWGQEEVLLACEL
ncbi:exodeoxyribonuclease V subunit alpha [Marinomonas sp. A79]|uniref:RecBCD enzyme subunit RecD n=1 Tax=Marinomonas vulgaris TaxID=2823372 RepID=A0ABS5HEP6_9GAMM|nr:exodeoxyribonuclease V subunit alpha [Marinomonas vulgaris]MBR7890136.1 exodeoxyribonuclease V subunit alpha [Marinomonas vulgaris]